MNTGIFINAEDDTAVRLVTAELDEFFARKVIAANAYGREFVTLWELAAERMRGGKFVRPLVLLQTIDALAPAANDTSGRSIAPTHVQIAAALELLHFSFLLHDDIIDGDVLRRGRPNLIGAILAQHSNAATPGSERIDALHWARSCAILMGDFLLSEVHQIFARVELGHHQRVRSLDLLDRAVTESVAGELIDVGLSDGVVAPELGTIIEMCRLKTATYSFELPLRLAAVLTDESPSIENALAAAGRHLGLAYQLHDDVLSTFSDPEEHGKDAFSDLREGKETALIAYARTTSAWASIEPHFGSAELSAGTALEVRRLLADCGAQAFVSSLIADELRGLDELLARESSGLPEGAQRALLALASELAVRTS